MFNFPIKKKLSVKKKKTAIQSLGDVTSSPKEGIEKVLSRWKVGKHGFKGKKEPERMWPGEPCVHFDTWTQLFVR